jgi:hypothetical protein
MSNAEVSQTLDEAVAEVLGLLTGLDLTYEPELDRYRAITRSLNRSLRANALESEWSAYASTLTLGPAVAGGQELMLPAVQRPRIINDDAVRLVDADGRVVEWAYFLPRDALHKYGDRRGLWCSVTQQSILFSRKFTDAEEALALQVVIPVQREPVMFRLPATGRPVSQAIRKQLIDFPYPDVIVARAAYMYAQTDPVMQPRAQTLEGGYKDLMYQLIERDTAITDTPFQNTFTLPLENGLVPSGGDYRPPLADY